MDAHSLARVVKREALVRCLAPTLGVEKSEEVVRDAAKRLNVLLGDRLRLGDALAIVEELTKAEGLVGVVARFVKARGMVEQHAADNLPTPSESFKPMGSVAERISESGSLVGEAQLLEIFAPTMGDDKAREALASAAARVGAVGPLYTRAQASAMLELLASAEGVVGAVARFGKARFILKFPA